MPPIKQINPTTYEVGLPFGDKVEIGDKEAGDFKPHLKLNRWGGECFIKVGLPIKGKRDPVFEGDKVKWIEPNLEAHLFPLEPKVIEGFTQNELGGFEFEIILKKKPAKNTITLDIETQGLKFYYQPPLTPKEIADGVVRPDNAIGSYAVYHATRTNMHRGKADAEKYKCGKAFHIYRPKVKDAVGGETWADLSLDEPNGKLVITVDRTWLDSAVYPVIIDPNFGYEVKGNNQAAGPMLKDVIHANNATTGTPGGNLQSITMWIEEYSGTQKVKFALYSDSGDYPNSLEAETDEWVVTDNYDSWKTLNTTSNPSLSAATKYWLSWLWFHYYPYTYYDSNVGFTNYSKENAYGDGFPATFPAEADLIESRQFSIYGIYEEVGGVTVTPGTISLTITEYAPPIIIGTILTPTTLNIGSTAYAPSIIIGTVVTPDKLGLTITSYAPTITVSDNKTVTPSTLSLTLTGYAPTVSITGSIVVTPTTASLTITSYAPSIVLGTVITPTTASLTLTGYAPILEEVVTPITLSLSITAYAPVIKETLTPNKLALILVTYAPSIIVGKTVTPSTLSLTSTAYAPVLGLAVIPPTLSLSLTGYAPLIIAILDLFSSETGVGIERASRAGWLMKPVVYTRDAFEQKVYTGE